MLSKIFLFLSSFIIFIGLDVVLSFTSFIHPRGRVSSSSLRVVNIDDTNYAEVLKTNDHVLVDVYATWCGPCKLIEPVLEYSEKRWKKTVEIVRFDVESENGKGLRTEMVLQDVTPRKLPFLVLFREGEAIATHEGIIKEEALNKWIQEHLPVPVATSTGKSQGFVSLTETRDGYMLAP